jgi:cysteine synthase
VAVEPESSRNLSGGPLGGHRIEGIGIGYPPPLFRSDLADRIEQVTDDEAREAARRLATTEGILAGFSSGANLAVALREAKALGPGTRVVTILVDSGLKYLAGDLYR